MVAMVAVTQLSRSAVNTVPDLRSLETFSCSSETALSVIEALARSYMR